MSSITKLCTMGLLGILCSQVGCGSNAASNPSGALVVCAPVAAYSGSTLTISDPLYAYQWHLKNTGQNGATIGEDIDVEPVWNACTDSSCRGEGVRVAVVDDGLEIAHEDLAANIAVGLSHDYLTGCDDPTGGTHGTSVAGLVAARDANGVGGRGVAPRAQLVGFNLLASYSLSNEADAMTRDLADVQVSNNSWGPPDGYGTLDAPSQLWKDAVDTGLANGRGGKGIVYLWAGGNGAPNDNSNYDGYANYRGVMAVCAVGDDGKRAPYSERGANLWVCAPSEGNDRQEITTTDRSGTDGYNDGQSTDYSNPNYTRVFNGTSAATPQVAGTAALMLQANPALSWREVRLLLAQTARKNDATDSEWTTNAGGYHIHPAYGFGVVDAAAAVTAAKAWNSALPAQHVVTVGTRTPSLAIPDNNVTGVSASMNVSGSGISHLEWVEVAFTAADHARSGDLAITLTAPSGTSSALAETHTCPSGCSTYSGWVFGTARDLGEAADGTWTLTVKDRTAGRTGTFQSWSLTLYGY